MRCTCCHEEVEEGKVVFFLNVMMCSRCAESARKIRDRLRSEVENVLATLDDSLRRFLVENSIIGIDMSKVSPKGLLELAVSVHRYSMKGNVDDSPNAR